MGTSPALNTRPDESVGLTNSMIYSGFHSREIAPGVHILGGCFEMAMYGRAFHTHASAYLICGDAGAILVDTGHAKDNENIEAYIKSVVGDDLLYIFPTHEEYPHAGNIASLLTAFPKATAIGEVRNYHLYYPELYASGRFRQMKVGETIELPGRRFEVLPAIIHDLPASYWAYEARSKIMFVSDGFGYSHTHESECTLFSTELPTPPTLADTRMVLDLALYWTRFADKRDLVEQVQALLVRYPTAMIAPAHGNVVTNPRELSILMDQALLSHGP